MYVRITRGRFQPERIDDVEALSSDIAEAVKFGSFGDDHGE